MKASNWMLTFWKDDFNLFKGNINMPGVFSVPVANWYDLY